MIFIKFIIYIGWISYLREPAVAYRMESIILNFIFIILWVGDKNVCIFFTYEETNRHWSSFVISTTSRLCHRTNKHDKTSTPNIDQQLLYPTITTSFPSQSPRYCIMYHDQTQVKVRPRIIESVVSPSPTFLLLSHFPREKARRAKKFRDRGEHGHKTVLRGIARREGDTGRKQRRRHSVVFLRHIVKTQ